MPAALIAGQEPGRDRMEDRGGEHGQRDLELLRGGDLLQSRVEDVERERGHPALRLRGRDRHALRQGLLDTRRSAVAQSREPGPRGGGCIEMSGFV